VTSINTKTDKKLKDITNKLQRSLHNRHTADYDEPAINNENGDETIPRPFLSKITGIMVIICFVVVLFSTQIVILDNRMTWAEKKLWPELLDYIGQLSNASNQVAPIIFRIPNFSKELASDSGRWSSNSFLAFEDGYEVFLIVSIAGNNEFKNVIISLLFNKNTLQELDYWPLRAIFTVELLNQVTNNDHYESLIPVDTDSCYLYKTDKNTFVCSTYFTSTGYLYQKSHWYLREDTMYLRVSYIKGLCYHLLRFKNYWFPNTRIFYNKLIACVWCCVVVSLTGECLDILDMNFLTSRFSSWKFFKFLVKYVLRLSVGSLVALYLYDYLHMYM